MGPRYGPGQPPRLRYWNYGRAGWYFVTFCTFLRRRSLTIEISGRRLLTPQGEITLAVWRALPQRFSGLTLGPVAIMHDHVHALIRMPGQADCQAMWRRHRGFVPMKTEADLVLGEVVRTWKARATWEIRRTGDPLFRWQKRYYESIIRDTRHLRAVIRYICRQSRTV